MEHQKISGITVCGANASTYAEYAGLRIWYNSTQYVDLDFPQTGSWDAASDREYSAALPGIKGVHDIRVQLRAGGLALNYVKFTENQ